LKSAARCEEYARNAHLFLLSARLLLSLAPSTYATQPPPPPPTTTSNAYDKNMMVVECLLIQNEEHPLPFLFLI